jgi:uncharacterized membrane protein
MIRFEEQTTVNAPAADVLTYVSDIANHAAWSGHGLEIARVDDGPVKAGTTFETVAKQFGTQREKSTVTELSATTFAWTSQGGLGTARHWFTVAGDGPTTVTKGIEFSEPSFLAKMLGFKLKKDAPKALRSDLSKIASVFG